MIVYILIRRLKVWQCITFRQLGRLIGTHICYLKFYLIFLFYKVDTQVIQLILISVDNSVVERWGYNLDIQLL